ncbi:SET domain-containing protein [Clathrospora elynae]|uniref:SET domain-containing protein n=1 Tax=Clathrospora elynae TaxID=706981 RepID=A0A6A5SSN1_9PLEO|nr:SET domain-containing protein [Clathrospora elynae]
MMALMTRGQHKQENMVHSSFIPPAYLPCITPVAQLTPIAIRDLRLEKHHRGRYLLLRVITPHNRMTGILVLVEDDHDDVVLLQLYQQEDEEIHEAADIVGIGAILLVKEPFFKITASGEYSLRVDHLSDVIHVDKNDPMTPEIWHPRISEAEGSAELLKSKGDYAMGERKYWQAIQKYSNALLQEATLERIKVIKRNRSLAYLKTKQFDAALSDTGFPSFGPDPTEKALFRAAEALYFLERFNECRVVLETLCAAFPDNRQGLIVLARTRGRCREESTGDYDFNLLQREAKKLRPPHLDHATYIGPVEIREAAGKGRGLFVTEAVKAGNLLLCEKAFSHAYALDSGSGNSKITFLMNSETNQGFMGGQADLIKLLVQKLYRNSSVAPAFVTLHHGSYDAASTLAVDGKPIVDTFLVERIMSFNVFGCPLSSLNTHKDITVKQSEKPKVYHSCGIWTQASYINHSCTSNASRSFIGDMMIVRATQDLEPGTEITFWYQTRDGYDPKGMQEKLGSWQFTCTCAICQDEKDTKAAVVKKRREIVDKLKTAFQLSASHDIKSKKVERLLNALNDTYTRPADEVPRLLLWDPQLALTRMYMAEKKVDKALESVQKVLIQLGFIIAGADSTSMGFRVVKWGLVVDHLIEVFLHARSAFEVIKAWEDSKIAEEYARIAYKIVVGEDTSFESSYGRREN